MDLPKLRYFCGAAESSVRAQVCHGVKQVILQQAARVLQEGLKNLEGPLCYQVIPPLKQLLNEILCK